MDMNNNMNYGQPAGGPGMNINPAPVVQKAGLSVLNKILIAAIVVVAGAGTAGTVYFTQPTVRIERHMKTAQKCLENADYEMALAEYDDVISIDEKFTQAYVGMLTAYENIGNQGDLEGFYDGLINTVASWDKDVIEDSMDDVVYIFEESDVVYANNEAKQMDALEVGLETTDNDSGLEKSYVDTGIDYAKSFNEEEKYDEELEVYDRMLNYTDKDKVLDSLSDTLDVYFAQLLDEQEYDKILELVEKYKAKLPDKDFETTQSEVETLQAYYDMLTTTLTNIAQKCQVDDFDGAFNLMHQPDFEEVLSYVDELGEIIAFETDYGKIGVYIVQTQNYGNHFIYYGDYNGDKREGNGSWLTYYEGNNYWSKGTWVEDAPDAGQTAKEWNSDLDYSVMYRVIYGDTDQGLWDGEVHWTFEMDGYTEDFPCSFIKGLWVVLRDDGDDWNVVSEGTGDNGEMGIYDSELYEIRGIPGFAYDE